MYSLNKVSYKVLDTVPGIQQAMNTFNDYYYCYFIILLWAHALGVLWLTQWWLKCIRACRLLSGLGLASLSTLTFHWFFSLLVTLHLNWPSSISLHMLNSFLLSFLWCISSFSPGCTHFPSGPLFNVMSHCHVSLFQASLPQKRFFLTTHLNKLPNQSLTLHPHNIHQNIQFYIYLS